MNITNNNISLDLLKFLLCNFSYSMLRAQLDTVPDKQGAHCPLAASQHSAFHSVPHSHKTFVKERQEIMFPGPAQTKFWETPELIAKLLTFLDLPSTLRLAKCHQLTQDVIQGSWVWNKLIKRKKKTQLDIWHMRTWRQFGILWLF